jgi:hypothetical protein
MRAREKHASIDALFKQANLFRCVRVRTPARYSVDLMFKAPGGRA